MFQFPTAGAVLSTIIEKAGHDAERYSCIAPTHVVPVRRYVHDVLIVLCLWHAGMVQVTRGQTITCWTS